jgi:hypothetical protein
LPLKVAKNRAVIGSMTMSALKLNYGSASTKAKTRGAIEKGRTYKTVLKLI